MRPFDKVKDQTLYLVYERCKDPNSGFPMTLHRLNEIMPDIGSSVFARKAINALIEAQLLEGSYVEEIREHLYEISYTGIEYVERELEDPTSEITNYAGKHSHILQNMSPIPASDRIVSLDHNRPEYKEATEKLDQVIDLVEADRSNDFDDKEQRVSELKAGRELLKSHLVNSKTIGTVLGTCLTFLTIKFADVAIGDLAATAWAAIKAVLGI